VFIQAGSVFLARLPYGSPKDHCCICLTDNGGMSDSVFVVPIMSPTPKCDRTTVLATADIPDFLKYDSYVSYTHLVEMDVTTLSTKIVRHFSPVSKEVLKRVIDGAFSSPLTARGYRQWFKDRLEENAKDDAGAK